MKIMLDEINSIIEIDKSDLLGKIARLPEQIIESKEIINNTTLPPIYKIDNIIICGMGASAISGEIIQNFFRDRLDIPIYINRRYDLPKWAHKNTLVISQSYSGDTEETLHSFKHGYQKRCKIIGISSGGKLEQFCKNREVPHVKIAENIPPRTATGYFLFCSLLTLKKIGILKNDYDSEIEESLSITKELRNTITKEIREEENIAKQIAKRIFGSIPQVYGFNEYFSIAKRWCTQFNENSKLICKYDEVSECNHNDIVGWSANNQISKQFTCIMFRDHESETVFLSKQLEFMKRLFHEVAKDVIEINVKGKKRLSKMLYAMLLGDFISVYLAILRKVDPTPIVAITELKDELSRL
jgi:glucose/mannose-6-phosphate isomerase